MGNFNWKHNIYCKKSNYLRIHLALGCFCLNSSPKIIVVLHFRLTFIKYPATEINTIEIFLYLIRFGFYF